MSDVFMGALIAGSVIGAIPAIIGATKGKLGRGLFAFFTCAAAGVMGGMLFAVPVAAFMPASRSTEIE